MRSAISMTYSSMVECIANGPGCCCCMRLLHNNLMESCSYVRKNTLLATKGHLHSLNPPLVMSQVVWFFMLLDLTFAFRRRINEATEGGGACVSVYITTAFSSEDVQKYCLLFKRNMVEQC